MLGKVTIVVIGGEGRFQAGGTTRPSSIKLIVVEGEESIYTRDPRLLYEALKVPGAKGTISS